MLAILRFRASRLGAEGFRPRLAARRVMGHRPTHWGIIHYAEEVGPAVIWCKGELLGETVRISQRRVCPNL